MNLEAAGKAICDPASKAAILGKIMPISDLTDEEIVQRLKELAGERDDDRSREDPYYEVLFNRYSTQLYSLSRYYGLRHEDANDVLQEGFIKLYQNILRFAPDKPFKPYFLKIILNLIRDKYRQLKRLKVTDIDLVQDELAGTDTPFEESLHKKTLVDSIINKMPPELKDVLLLKIQTGMNVESVAESLGISRRLAYYRYKKATAYLKNKTGGEL